MFSLNVFLSVDKNNNFGLYPAFQSANELSDFIYNKSKFIYDHSKKNKLPLDYEKIDKNPPILLSTLLDNSYFSYWLIDFDLSKLTISDFYNIFYTNKIPLSFNIFDRKILSDWILSEAYTNSSETELKVLLLNLFNHFDHLVKTNNFFFTDLKETLSSSEITIHAPCFLKQNFNTYFRQNNLINKFFVTQENNEIYDDISFNGYHNFYNVPEFHSDNLDSKHFISQLFDKNIFTFNLSDFNNLSYNFNFFPKKQISLINLLVSFSSFIYNRLSLELFEEDWKIRNFTIRLHLKKTDEEFSSSLIPDLIFKKHDFFRKKINDHFSLTIEKVYD